MPRIDLPLLDFKVNGKMDGKVEDSNGVIPPNGLSYYYCPKQTPLIFASIGDIFQDNARKHPNRPAIVLRTGEGTRQMVTYAELSEKAESFAKHLVSFGVRVGNRVAVSVYNSIEWVICEFGILLAGAVAVNLIPSKRENLEKTLKNIECKAVVFDTRWLTDDDTFLPVSNENYVCQIFLASEKSTLPHGCFYLDDLLLKKLETVELPPIIDPDSICLMWSTSGSTGPYKFVPHSHLTILNSWDTFVKGLGITEQDIIFQELPMAYGLGFPMHLVTLGGTHVYANTNGIAKGEVTKFVFDMMKLEKAGAAFFPSFFLAEFKRFSETGLDPPRLRTGLTTGQRLDQETTNIYKRFGNNICFGYGLTDTLLCSATPHSNIEWDSKPIGSHIFPGIEFKVIGNDGMPVKFGDSGEICIRGPNCTKRYIKQDGSTLAALDEAGWFKTGDLGTLRQDGLVTVQGRVKEIIRRGDVDVLPADVEGELMSHPGVEEAVVVGIQNGHIHDYICACILGTSGHNLSENDIRHYAEARFYKGKAEDILNKSMPDYFFLLDSIPRLHSGKPDRSSLQTLAKSIINGTNL